jgi:hypothetical protein
MKIALALAAVLAAATIMGCDDAEDDPDGNTSSDEETVSFDEGTILMDIEFLDTGLLKGRSYVNAAEGWEADGLTVTAALDDGTRWGVIEIPEQGDADSTTFFEVQVQELPRGDQVTLTTTAFFVSESGARSQRAITDTWPP